MIFTVFFAAATALSGLQAPDLTPLDPATVNVCGDGECVLFDGVGRRTPIVFADEPRAEKAAAYLASVLEEMSGGEWTRYRLPTGVSNTIAACIYIPRPADGDAFSVDVGADGVKFRGRTDFAAYDFAERLLGVRHYWDGPGGRAVPKRDSLALPFLAYSDAPVFAFRRYWPGGGSDWFRVAKGGGTFDRWAQGHTTEAGFCYGSPEGFREYCRRVDAAIAGREDARMVDRRRKVVSVSPGDVAYDCRCRWCRTLRRTTEMNHGRMTSVIWERFLPRFVNYLSQHHPDYRVSVLPYWNYVAAPAAGTDLGTNVQAEVCSMSGLATFKSEDRRACEEGIILDWERVTGRKVANWHYSCWPADYTTAPYVFGETIASHYRRLRAHLVGSFICGGTNDFPRLSLSLYVWARCLWNPDIDVAAVYDEFCRRQFGPAAETMRELVALQEEAWNPETLRFTDEVRARMARLINRAAEEVRGTPYAPAFDYYRRGFCGDFEFQTR